MTADASTAPAEPRDAFDVILGFVNTRLDPKAGRVESLGTAKDFSQWARESGLLDDQTVTESEAAAARELRAALVILMLAHANPERMTRQQIEDAERHLVHAGESYPVKVTISTSGSAVTGHGRGAAGVLGGGVAAAK